MIKKVVVIASLCLLALPLTTNAYNNGRWFNGGQYSEVNGNFVGSKTDIVTTANYPAIGNSHFTCAWTMLADHSGINEKFAQVGFVIDNQYTYPRYFYGWATNGRSSYKEVISGVGPARGSTHTYKIEYVSSSWEGKVDDTVIATKSISMNPGSTQNYQENDETVFIGTSSDKLKFTNVSYKKSGGSWTKPSLSFVAEGSSSIDHSNYNSSGYWQSWK
ncbi:hypothetical protein [Paenibacillus puerhi]|uniref:hypothetical protein n=1 Tax=Paenibacillus puerhi TaxID=2692622 RepID=UPI00135CF5CA|nr:hypothetical protein [Paenibacillus puerhi]